MSVKQGIEMIRQSRKLVLIGTDPFSWEILSSGGDYKHHLVYDEGREDVVCLECEARHGVNRCWARGRVLADLERRFGTPKLPLPKPVPEPEEPAIGSLSWREAFAEARERSA